MNRYEENVVFVLQKTIETLKIKVTKSSVKKFLLSHPHYPSLKSVCDAFKKWNVEHYPLNLEMREIKELEMPFIAHLKISGGQLVFVEKIENGQITYFASEGKEITEDFEKFAEKLSGAVVVLDAGNDSGEKEYSQIRQNEILNKSLLPLGGFTILALATLGVAINTGSSLFQYNYIFWGLVCTKTIGLTASVFLVLHELKVHTPLTDKICGFSSKTDCDTVLLSNASKLFGWVNWADTGIIYFAGTLIFLLSLSGTPSLSVLSIISALSLPYPLFSIYYQAVKAKKWCPFCLMIQVVLIAEFLLLIPVFKSISFSGIEILKLIVSFLVPASIWIIYKAFYNKSGEQKKEHYSFLQFKRNPDIFKYLLKSNGYTGFVENKNSFVLGNPDAKLTLTVFLSLYCKPCATAFNQLKILLENSPDVKMNLIFSVYNDENSQKLINVLYYLYRKKGNNTTVDFLNKWYTTNKPSRKTLYENIISGNFDVSKQIKDENKKLFEKHKVTGTPTVYVNGYKYPTQYEYIDIEYYIDEIKTITRERKRQEACTKCN